jgi:TnpA family transposase
VKDIFPRISEACDIQLDQVLLKEKSVILTGKDLSRKKVAWLNLHYVTEKYLEDAIGKVVNAYNKFVLPKYWGSGKSVSADDTKWNVYEQSLLSEYHIRYGGYAGIGY